ncbi:MAG: glutamate 5-kinase [Candidatus Hydrogenedentes bacterium]|nr:glutamate 5-kinase [Candidatus Hydrogenedentota bacterium]
MSTIPTDLKTLVVKIGTTLLSDKRPFDGRLLEGIVEDVARLKRERGMNVLIVSSGAIGCGMNALGLTERPKLLPLKQATAAVGQAALMHSYETLFRTHGKGIKTAQVLLSASDLDNRQTYLNVRNTIHALFDLGAVVPIVNENDSTATEELKFGDNDTLAAKIAAKIDADLLIILSDVDGLFDKNPARYKSAKLIEYVEEITDAVEALAGDTVVETSVGGMKTKLAAAKIACSAGLPVVLANGRKPHIILDVLGGRARATLLAASADVLPHRKRWIAFGRKAQGAVRIDNGARAALLERGKSLLAAGIADVQGHFTAGAAIKVLDTAGREIARGLTNYGSEDLLRIKGCSSKEIAAILGQKDFDEAIHRNNLVVLQ